MLQISGSSLGGESADDYRRLHSDNGSLQLLGVKNGQAMAAVAQDREEQRCGESARPSFRTGYGHWLPGGVAGALVVFSLTPTMGSVLMKGIGVIILGGLSSIRHRGWWSYHRFLGRFGPVYYFNTWPASWLPRRHPDTGCQAPA